MYEPDQLVWAKLDWRGCPDERPWLLIDIRRGGEVYGAFPISTKLYRSGGPCMTLRVDHVDFPDSGLKERSYIYYESTFDVGDEEIRRVLGRLTGDLLDRLKVAAGL